MIGVRDQDFDELREDVEAALLRGARAVGILGLTDTALRLVGCLGTSGLINHVQGVLVEARVAAEAADLTAVAVDPGVVGPAVDPAAIVADLNAACAGIDCGDRANEYPPPDGPGAGAGAFGTVGAAMLSTAHGSEAHAREPAMRCPSRPDGGS